MENIKQKYLLLLLAFITLTLFFNTLESEKFNLDDVPLIDEFIEYNHSMIDLLRIDNGRPYSFVYGDNFRPMFGLSLLLDFRIWFDEIRGYHLTNIIIHLLNVLWLYFFAQLLLANREKQRETAFIAALVFAIHPIHTESVDWVVGRQDPMAAFFLLSSFILYLKWKEWRAIHYPVFIGLLFFAGLSSREITVVLIPLIICYEFFLNFRNNEQENSKSVLYRLAILIPLLTLIFIAFSTIQEIYSSGNIHEVNRFSALVTYMRGNSPVTLIFQNSAYLGYYFWKLFYPFPLNFALTQIGLAFHFTFFCILSPLTFFYLRKERIMTFLAIAILISVLPNLAARFFSWTVVAERYLYIPSLFFSILIANTLIKWSLGSLKYNHIFKTLFGVSFILFCFTIINRNYQWQDNYRFWKNAVKKSPNSGTVWSNYAYALSQNYKAIQFQKKNISLISKAPLYRKVKPAPEANIPYIKKIIEKAAELGDKKGYLLFVQLSILNNDMDSAKEYISRIKKEDFKTIDTILALGNSYEVLGKKEATSEVRETYYNAAVYYYKGYIRQRKEDYYIGLKIARLLNLLSKNEEALEILDRLSKKKDLTPAIEKGIKRLKDKIEKVIVSRQTLRV